MARKEVHKSMVRCRSKGLKRILLLVLTVTCFFSCSVMYAYAADDAVDDSLVGAGHSWTESADQSIYTGDESLSADEDTSDDGDRDVSTGEKILSGIVRGLAAGVNKLLSFGNVSLDSIVLGRVGGNADSAMYTFELVNGNPYGTVAAIGYSIMRSMVFVWMIFIIMTKFVKSIYSSGDGQARNALKQSISSFVLSMCLLILMPYLLDVALYLRDQILYGIFSKFLGLIDSDSASLSLIGAFKDTAESSKTLSDAVMYLGASFLSVWFIFEYVGMALALLLMVLLFPFICVQSNVSKNALGEWVKNVFSTVVTPILDIVLLCIPLLFATFFAEAELLKLALCACVVPARKTAKNFLGLSSAGAGVLTAMSALAMARGVSGGAQKIGRGIRNAGDKVKNGVQDMQRSKYERDAASAEQADKDDAMASAGYRKVSEGGVVSSQEFGTKASSESRKLSTFGLSDDSTKKNEAMNLESVEGSSNSKGDVDGVMGAGGVSMDSIRNSLEKDKQEAETLTATSKVTLNTLQKRKTEIEEENAGLNSRNSALAQENANYEHKNAELEELRANSHDDGERASLQGQILANRTKMAANKQTMADNQSRISANKSSIAAINGNIAQENANIAQNGQQITSLNNAASNIRAASSTLGGKSGASVSPRMQEVMRNHATISNFETPEFSGLSHADKAQLYKARARKQFVSAGGSIAGTAAGAAVGATIGMGAGLFYGPTVSAAAAGAMAGAGASVLGATVSAAATGVGNVVYKKAKSEPYLGHPLAGTKVVQPTYTKDIPSGGTPPYSDAGAGVYTQSPAPVPVSGGTLERYTSDMRATSNANIDFLAQQYIRQNQARANATFFGGASGTENNFTRMVMSKVNTLKADNDFINSNDTDKLNMLVTTMTDYATDSYCNCMSQGSDVSKDVMNKVQERVASEMRKVMGRYAESEMERAAEKESQSFVFDEMNIF